MTCASHDDTNHASPHHHHPTTVRTPMRFRPTEAGVAGMIRPESMTMALPSVRAETRLEFMHVLCCVRARCVLMCCVFMIRAMMTLERLKISRLNGRFQFDLRG
jgi:hypothetical protein